nr:hypothetical protein [Mycobacterium sp.]
MIGILARLGLVTSLTISAAGHAYLYVHGYQHIPTIGIGFLVQASVSSAIALLILVGGPGWLRWAAATLAAGDPGWLFMPPRVGGRVISAFLNEIGS